MPVTHNDFAILAAGDQKLFVDRFAQTHVAEILEQHQPARFIRRHGLCDFRMNPHFPVNTLKIMRGACAAQQLGCLMPYVDAVYAAMWQQQLNMADDAVISAALQAAGLDAQALLATSQQPEVKERLLQNTQAAHERGAVVAVDGQVVPRGRWSETRLAEGVQILVIRAAQGG